MPKTTVYLKEWQFKNRQDDDWMKTTVPSTVHMDLYRNEVIPHPFEETNERDLQWVDKEVWEYQNRFLIDSDMYRNDHIDIIFEGLDTITTVYINGKQVLETDNMFRRWKIDIKSFIMEGSNDIKIIFHSPIHYGLKKLEESEYALPATMDDSEMGGLGDKKVSMFLRKAPYHFGWDWGPRFATSGIWRDVKIEAWSAMKIEELYVQQKSILPEKAEVVLQAAIHSSFSQKVNYSVKVKDQTVEGTINLQKGVNSFSVPVSLLEPDLWWTHDLGEQAMTAFHLTLSNSREYSESASVKTGLRSIDLVREKDEEGTSFYFKLNGVPLFAKGANHIPLDSFIPEIDVKRYETEIEHAVDTNMNMIRVWGGGIYEEDIFYDLCDERGLLVWQDFMFACSMYPGTEEFLHTVSQEAEDTIKRLRNHPSLAVWCGNNEIDSMWKEYTDKTYLKWKEAYSPDIREKVWQAYDTIFHQLLPNKLNEFMPDTNYWPSSPMAELSYSDSQHAGIKGSKGDIHLWNVWHSGSPIEDYNHYIGRFMSEYGFQSFPQKETLEKIAGGQPLSMDAEVVNFHQKNKSGNTILNKYLNRYYKQPKNFESFIYLSQSLQGYAFETAIRAHRREMPYCMGTLYWQLNDVWPGASWSTIDYYGNKKLSHYRVKDAYKKTIIAYKDDDQKIDIFGVTDLKKSQKLNLSIQVYSLKDHSILDERFIPVSLEANSSSLLYTIDKEELFSQCEKKDTILISHLIKENEPPLDTFPLLSVPLKDIHLDSPDIGYYVEKEGTSLHYYLNSNRFSKSVLLELDIEGEFEHNGMDLFPHTEVTVTFKAKNKVDIKELPNLKINSMVNFIEQ